MSNILNSKVIFLYLIESYNFFIEVNTYIKLPTLGIDAGVLGGAVLCKHN